MKTSVAIVVLLSSSLIPLSDQQYPCDWEEGEQTRWEYEDQNAWPKTCFGNRQSPINLPSICYPTKANPITIDKIMRYDLLDYNRLLPFASLKLENNGKTVEFNVEPWIKEVVNNTPTVRVAMGGRQTGQYQFYQLHFHWAFNKTYGSEHTITGSRKAMEIHLVHWNKKYTNRDEAATKADGLLVLGVLFSEDTVINPSLNPIIDQLKLIHKMGQEKSATRTFSLQSILPQDTEFFYMYQGSLTTPPCTEAVTWIIVAEIQRFGYSQLREFQKLDHAVDRVRKTQERNGREVFANSNVFCDMQSKTL